MVRPLLIAIASVLAATPLPAAETKRPNIVFILADDLGYGDLGCYGQKRFATPNIDRLAAEGMRFTRHYSGCNVCAPSRCVLMSGLHTGHAVIRDNRQAPGFPEGQTPVPANSLPLPERLHASGYVLGGFGKWGLGPVGSTGDPLKHGFDRWFGYNCQAVAHNYYPTQLWNDDKPFPLKNPKFAAHQKLPADADPKDPKSYEPFRGNEYAPDVIGEKAREFVRANRAKPFFLYYPTTVPHLALQVPEDSLKPFHGKFPEKPYLGGSGYLPHPQPRAAYAAMISRMDRDVGKLLELLAELKLDDDTIVIFTSDNGPLYDQLGGTDDAFFNSAGGLRGRKGSFYEGGFRVPCLVRWPGRVAKGGVSDRVTGFEDWLPTLFEAAGLKEKIPAKLDGISFLPTLEGAKQEPRAFLYRESPGYGGQQCVLAGPWKAIRRNLHPGAKAKEQGAMPLELYDLSTDPAESRDVAKLHPDIAARMQALLDREHVKSELFPLRAVDEKK
ncbi:MAG: arylsulfatase [Gemmataceae bacterium]